MRYQADYRKAVRAAEETLQEYGDTLIPLRLERIIDRLSNEIKLITYSEFCEMHGLTMEDVIRMLDSDLGACVYMPHSCQYLILYNDMMPTDVCRFTIGHELGHIFENHHEIAGSDILSRTYVPKKQYEEFEKEANAYSRNLISPAPLANRVNKRSHGTAIRDMSRVFFISSKAAKVRIDYIKRDLKYLSTEMISFFTRFHAVRRTRVCPSCQMALEPDMYFCPLCGTGYHEVGYAYQALPADEPVETTVCPQCGNARLLKDALYCHICGSPVSNLCACGRVNPSYALFCVSCGDITRNGRVKSIISGGIRQMDYGPHIPHDKITLKVEKCPKCLYGKHLKDASFCIMCGTDLYNSCDGNNEQEERHPNPPNARFCYICGRPTAYSAFLPVYTELIAEQREQFNEELSEADISPALHNRIIGADDNTSAEQPQKQVQSTVSDDELPF